MNNKISKKVVITLCALIGALVIINIVTIFCTFAV